MEKKIALNNGYIWNEETNRLERFEFVKATFTINSPTVKYYCKLGGEECVLEESKLKVYRNENDFKQGLFFCNEFVTEQKYERDLNIFFEDGIPFGWVCDGGHAEKENAGDILITVFNSGILHCDKRFYRSEKEVYRYNDIVTLEADGTTTTVRSIASKMKFTEKQKQLIEQMKKIGDEMENEGLMFIMDREVEKMKVINSKEIDNVRPSYGDAEDNEIIITEFAEDVLYSYTSYCSDEDLVATEKQ